MGLHLLLHPQHFHRVRWNQLVELAPFVVLPVDAVASMLACVFVSRDYDGLPHGQGHTLGIARLYIDDSDLKRIYYSHSEVLSTFDSYILQYASIAVSFRHSAV
jgi:hypothetical protein